MRLTNMFAPKKYWSYIKIAQRVGFKRFSHFAKISLQNVIVKYELDMVIVIPTYKCNLKCVGCFEENSAKPEMEGRTLERILKKLTGVRNIVFMGGELVYPNSIYLNIIIKYAAEHQKQNISIITNGTMLNVDIVQKLTKNNIFIFISIDGSEFIHDLRRGKGSYCKLSKSIELLNSYKALFGVITTVTKVNAENVLSEKYVDSIKKLGASFLIFFPFYLSKASSADEYSLSVTQIEFVDAFVDTSNENQSGIRLFSSVSYECRNGGCPAGSDLLIIDSDASVKCCPQMEENFFSINHGKLSSRLNHPYYKEMFLITSSEKCSCLLRNGIAGEMHIKYLKSNGGKG